MRLILLIAFLLFGVSAYAQNDTTNIAREHFRSDMLERVVTNNIGDDVVMVGGKWLRLQSDFDDCKLEEARGKNRAIVASDGRYNIFEFVDGKYTLIDFGTVYYVRRKNR